MIETTSTDLGRTQDLATSRALSALQGLALGDALGMPTQSMSHAAIVEDYGSILELVAAGSRQRIAAGMPAGSITDDTEQALLLARLLIAGHGRIEPADLADALLDWEREMADKGSLDLLGPSTKVALERLADGVPADEAGRGGTTNGAAMRIAPIGIAVDASSLGTFVDAVEMVSRITHGTTIGLAAAAAVGAAVSVGVGGGSLAEAVEVAAAAADLGEHRGRWAAGGSIAARLRWAVPYVLGLPAADRPIAVRDVIGTSVAAQESVIAAFALAVASPEPWDALCTAATLGGDTDTVAAIAGAVLGATSPTNPWPAGPIRTVTDHNGLELEGLARDLVDLRLRRPEP